MSLNFDWRRYVTLSTEKLIRTTFSHKDYLFQKRLALRLPIDSFRFDFRYVSTLLSRVLRLEIIVVSFWGRGNHETPGTWKFGNFDDDVVDIEVVVAYLRKEYGYVVDMLVGHSRGSVVSLLWICKHREDDSMSVTRFVNVSGRYRMEVRSPPVARPNIVD